MRIKVIFIFVFIIATSCIEDVIPPTLTGELEGSAEILRYIESKGDYINTLDAPAILEAEEVNSHINDYILIDIRISDEFVQGHIENAVNISNSQILNFIDSVYDGLTKIIFISENGQSASYYTALLRLIGYRNIYSLNFGMAAWNQDFADEWLGALGDDPGIDFYVKTNNPKNDLSGLPEVTFQNAGESIENRVRQRVSDMLETGFKQNTTFIKFFSIYFKDYLVCYGEPRIYNSRQGGPYDMQGHPPTAIYYQSDPVFDLRSVKNLQTLPPDKSIIVYDGNGELSAAVVAFLRLLGYNAVTLLFGGNQLFYSRIADDPELQEYKFSFGIIRNFPYITGN
jgi:rhodanese-related sulfurtransferase